MNIRAYISQNILQRASFGQRDFAWQSKPRSSPETVRNHSDGRSSPHITTYSAARWDSVKNKRESKQQISWQIALGRAHYS
jgi:hypothetical protein